MTTDNATRVEERLEYVLDCAHQVGFDDFDEIMSAYYTSKFDDGSPLKFDQRQSRNRKLPGLLAAVRKSSATWTNWEKQGYYAELFRAAEVTLQAEFGSFICSRTSKGNMLDMDSVISSQEGHKNSLQGTGGVDVLPHSMVTFYTKMPNLWATLMALATADAVPCRFDQLKFLFVCNLVLCASGCVPTWKLSECIEAYLEQLSSKAQASSNGII